jgi:hypothetical protein
MNCLAGVVSSPGVRVMPLFRCIFFWRHSLSTSRWLFKLVCIDYEYLLSYPSIYLCTFLCYQLSRLSIELFKPQFDSFFPRVPSNYAMLCWCVMLYAINVPNTASSYHQVSLMDQEPSAILFSTAPWLLSKGNKSSLIQISPQYNAQRGFWSEVRTAAEEVPGS